MSGIQRYAINFFGRGSIPSRVGNWVEYDDHMAEVQQLRQQVAALEEKLSWLSDPAKVHTNILRGTIALTKAQAIHIAGLPADIENQVRALREALTRPVQTHEAQERGLFECEDPELIEQIQGIYAARVPQVHGSQDELIHPLERIAGLEKAKERA
jgi:hypothetical protein